MIIIHHKIQSFIHFWLNDLFAGSGNVLDFERYKKSLKKYIPNSENVNESTEIARL